MTTVTETDACLLSYDLTSYPNPLTTGSHTPTPGTRSEQPTADIDLVISNSGLRDVECSRITIVLPIGTLAQDLASDGQSINAYVQPADAWTLVPVQDDVLLAIPATETAHFPAGASTSKTFTLTPARGGTATVNTDGLHIRLTNIHVNAQPGIARLTIEEHTTDNDQDPTPRRTHLTLAKYPGRSTGALDHPGVGRDLIAFKASSTEPAILIDSGTPIDLRWYHESTDTHTLYYNGKTKTFGADPVSGYQTFPLKAENGDCPTRDTTYVLHTARATQEAGIVDRWDTLTVTIKDPTLNALTVANQLQANGAVTAAQTLDVTGRTTASTLDVTSNATVTGTLGVTG
ncbi:hypothetical protein ACFVXG_15595, partial [Kitasatospora sp. NPDC058162]|uniref:hypothetical protein n=1 Tax=Kitasatospora sp. NPDC058162 TaxID=3346362 RepID=UPI0036D7F2CB